MSTNYYGLAVPLALRRFRIAPFARNLYGQKVSLPRDLSPGINILHLNYRRKHRKVFAEWEPGHEWVREMISEYAIDEINILIEGIQDPTHPLYQDWFDGKYGVEGRSGGYLVLEHDLYDTLESDADLDYIDDFFAVNIFGHTRIGTPLDELVDLESVINDTILALNQRQRQ